MDWVVHGSDIFVFGNRLKVLDVSSGREKRSVSIAGRVFTPALPSMLTHKSSLIVARYDGAAGVVTAYDLETLATIWKRRVELTEPETAHDVGFSLVADGDFLWMLVTGVEGGNLLKLNARTGEHIWTQSVDRFVTGVPLTLKRQRLLVRSRVDRHYPSGHGHYQAIDPETGRIVWRVRLEGLAVVKDDEPLVANDIAILTGRASPPPFGHLHSVHLPSGRLFANFIVTNVRQPFAAEGSLVYFGGNTPAAYTIGAGIPTLRWQATILLPNGVPANIVAAAVLDTSTRRIYLGDYDRTLYVISADDGGRLATVDLRGRYRDPVKGGYTSYGVRRLALIDGRLFVGTVDGSLLTFTVQ